MLEYGALLLLAHAVAHAAPIAIAGRRALLEAGLRRYDPVRHRLYRRREGDGPSVLFLHGLGGSWRYWRRGVEGVGMRHRLYLPDLLGFGRSPKPRGDYSLPMHVEALAAVIDEADGPVTVVGHSMGAIVALGVHELERVQRLILIGLPHFPSREIAEASLAKLSPMNRLLIRGSWLAPGVCFMKDVLGLPVFAPLFGMPMDLYRDYWKHTWVSFSRSFFNTLLATDVVALLGRVDRTKITLVHGRHDPVAPIQYVRGLVDHFPDLTLRALNGGHHVYLMYPRLVNRLITAASAVHPASSAHLHVETHEEMR